MANQSFENRKKTLKAKTKTFFQRPPLLQSKLMQKCSFEKKLFVFDSDQPVKNPVNLKVSEGWSKE